jgi:hypothetical protein
MTLAQAKADDAAPSRERSAPHATPSSASARYERRERDASIRLTRRRRRTIYESSLYEADQLGTGRLVIVADPDCCSKRARSSPNYRACFRCAGWSTLRLAERALAERAARRRLLDEALARLRPLGDRWGVACCLELDQAVAKGSLSPARQG